MIRNNSFLFVVFILFSIFLIYQFDNYSFADTGMISVDSHNVKYDVSNGKIESIFLDPDFFELLVTMNTSADGVVKITIPRDLLDAKFELTDDMFFVLVDGFETEYVESESNANSRTLMIPYFNGDSTIEIIGTNVSNPFIPQIDVKIPDWIKNTARWWSNDQIKDTEFVSAIQYLIKEEIMTIPPTSSGVSSTEGIPNWIKNTAGWWADGLIKDTEFVSGIQYLITNGIMHI